MTPRRFHLGPRSAAVRMMSAIWPSTATGRAPSAPRTSSPWTASSVTAAKDTATTASVRRDPTSVWRCTDQVCVCVCVCVVSLYTTLLCWSRCNKRCDRLLSSGATEARQYCYEQNTRGTYFAFCKRPSDNIWIPCQGPWVSASRVTICSRPESSEWKSSSE